VQERIPTEDTDIRTRASAIPTTRTRRSASLPTSRTRGSASLPSHFQDKRSQNWVNFAHPFRWGAPGRWINANLFLLEKCANGGTLDAVRFGLASGLLNRFPATN